VVEKTTAFRQRRGDPSAIEAPITAKERLVLISHLDAIFPLACVVFFLLPVGSRRIGIVRQVFTQSAQQNLLSENAVVKLTT
jgi:hypothetical protein